MKPLDSDTESGTNAAATVVVVMVLLLLVVLVLWMSGAFVIPQPIP